MVFYVHFHHSHILIRRKSPSSPPSRSCPKSKEEANTAIRDELAGTYFFFQAKKLEQYAVQITGLNTRVSLLQQRHEVAQRQCRQWEELYERMRARATEQLVDVTFVKESCGRIYREICERKGVAPLYKDNYEKQLEVIKETLRDYKCINELAKRAEQEKLYVSEKALVSQVTD